MIQRIANHLYLNICILGHIHGTGCAINNNDNTPATARDLCARSASHEIRSRGSPSDPNSESRFFKAGIEQMLSVACSLGRN